MTIYYRSAYRVGWEREDVAGASAEVAGSKRVRNRSMNIILPDSIEILCLLPSVSSEYWYALVVGLQRGVPEGLTLSAAMEQEWRVLDEARHHISTANTIQSFNYNTLWRIHVWPSHITSSLTC